MQTYFGYVSLGIGRGQQKVFVQARNNDDARRLLEAQYGRGNVSSVQWAGH